MKTRSVREFREFWWTWRRSRPWTRTDALGIAITVGLLAFAYVVFKFFALIQSMTL